MNKTEKDISAESLKETRYLVNILAHSEREIKVPEDMTNLDVVELALQIADRFLPYIKGE